MHLSFWDADDRKKLLIFPVPIAHHELFLDRSADNEALELGVTSTELRASRGKHRSADASTILQYVVSAF